MEKNESALIIVDKVKDKHVVQYSRPLLGLWTSEFTLTEFKLFNLYLSQINSHDPDHCRIRIEKKELERAFGVERLKPEILETNLKNLMSHVVKIVDPNKESGFALISLFEIAVCEKDSNGLWQIEMECTRSAMKYCFNVENFGYLKYTIDLIVKMDSLYCYKLFQYLISNRYRRSWVVSLEELKDTLGCNTEFYGEYRRFNELLLKKWYKVLNTEIGLHFDYEPIRMNRKVVSLRFTFHGLSGVIDTVPSQSNAGLPDKTDSKVSFESVPAQLDPEIEYELEGLDEASDHTFDRDALKTLYKTLCAVSNNSNARYDLFAKCYDRLLARENDDRNEPVKDRVAYLVATIKQAALEQNRREKA